ncbi:hypothetical protein FA95DRAFT_446476 [Auriscalpium vulgare]|uniref:Uncharacterized protein n=1 Tax=Auriscalpium vulgare TaxID=40419 RepID=A0ACB8RG19_9AGAM|nr:hypothetical protein FA95DRAFT_446476 [Auriscalpium vulgare]
MGSSSSLSTVTARTPYAPIHASPSAHCFGWIVAVHWVLCDCWARFGPPGFACLAGAPGDFVEQDSFFPLYFHASNELQKSASPSQFDLTCPAQDVFATAFSDEPVAAHEPCRGRDRQRLEGAAHAGSLPRKHPSDQ